MKIVKNQEVRVIVDVSLTVAMKHDAATVRRIVDRGTASMFQNNWKKFHEVRFAEEAAIYRPDRRPIHWEYLHRPESSNPLRDRSGAREGVKVGKAMPAVAARDRTIEYLQGLLCELRKLCDAKGLDFAEIDRAAYTDYVADVCASAE